MLALAVESWIWYGVAIFVTICRLISRSLLYGSPLRLKVDDWIMVFAICTYTTLLVTMNIVADTSSNLLPPGTNVHDFTQQEIDERVYGSKLVLVVEQMQCSTIWTLKTTLLIMYYRVTFQLPQNLYVKILAVYVGVGFVVMEILYFGVWCRPFDHYWAIPTQPQCDAATNHLITNAVLNISSDLIMIAIGLSLSFKSKLPWKRKIIVHAIFALGSFVIIAAILNKYYSFSNPYGSEWTFWYIRESSTAMIVANLPYTWTLIRRVFNVGSFSGEGDTEVKYHSSRSARGRRTQSHPKTRVLNGESFSMSDKNSSDLESGFRKDSAFPSGRYSPEGKRIEPLKPPKTKTWRERGVYGKDDAEAMGSDIEEEEDFEVAEGRRRCSSAIAENPWQEDEVDDEIELLDVGSLGAIKPASKTERPHSPPLSQDSSYSKHRRTPSDPARHSRPGSASGAPETVGRSPSKRSSWASGQTSQPRPLYASGRSKAKMPGQPKT